MAGVDTVRGIGYQQAQALIAALGLLDDPTLASLRVEGLDDIIDIELRRHDGSLAMGIQAKTRASQYTWGRAELVAQLLRWVAVDAPNADFVFATDGALGPSGEVIADSLARAHVGDTAALEEALGADVASPEVLRRLSRASVIIDPTGVSASILRAERQVLSLLSGNPADALERAEGSVQRLFIALFDRGGRANGAERMFTRAEIAQILGVPDDQPTAARWPGTVRERILSATMQERLTVDARVQDLDDPAASDNAVSVSQFLEHGVAMLSGATGSGKSTIALVAAAQHSAAGNVTVVARAEGYGGGQLARMIADAIGAQLSMEVPVATGRQLLGDRAATVVIDGASEIPPTLQASLRADLYSHLSAPGANIVLVGRDAAALRHLLPAGSSVRSYGPQALQRDTREAMAKTAIDLLDAEDASDDAVTVLVARAERALGDAAGNPLLLQMAYEALLKGASFESPAELYRLSLERLSMRGATVEITVVTAALGAIFCQLLDEGRRYANALEWGALALRASALLADRGVQISAGDLTELSLQAGIVYRASSTQLFTPIHDSYADYMAAVAHVHLGIDLPETLRPSDDQRLRFLSEIGEFNADLSLRLVRERPFLIPHIGRYDRRVLNAGHRTEIVNNLQALVPGQVIDVTIDLTRTPALVALTWLPESDRLTELEQTTVSVVEQVGLDGPLSVVARLWRAILRRGLRPGWGFWPVAPADCLAAATVVENYLLTRQSLFEVHVAELLRQNQVAEFVGAVGATGMTAVIHQEPALDSMRRLYYRATPGVSVRCVDVVEEVDFERGGRTTVEYLLQQAPRAAALKMIEGGLAAMFPPNWIAG